LVFAVLCAWLLPGVRKLQHDDDVLAFLPPDHPDVVAFREVADAFGMLEVALVGVRAPSGASLLTVERAEQVRTLGRVLAELPGTRLVLDFPSLPDLRVEGDTLAVDPLVPKGLTDDAELRTRVLGNRDAVGNLVSADGTAATLLVYMLPDDAEGGSRAERLADIRRVTAEHWDGEAYFGGAPFIESAAAESSRADIERLSPIVIAVLTLTSALLLRSFTAAVMNLLIAGLGVGLVVGAHGVFGEPFTIVSSTTPVMMVALGGAFGMHLISGYQRRSGAAVDRASGALRELWVPVVLSAATTSVSFFALVVMPQVPMQRFGIVAGAGVLGLLAIALLVVPPMLSLLPAKLLAPRPSMVLPFSLRAPLWLLLVLAIVGGWFGSTLKADPDTRNVFDPSSEPARTDAFFNDNFGGSQYIQIAINADMREPIVLRAIRDLAEQLREVEGVVDVRSLVEPVESLTEGFGGRRGIPQNEGQATRVLGNLADHPAMAQLLMPDLGGAIVHVKLAPLDSAALERANAAVREIVAGLPEGPLGVGEHSDASIAADQRETVRRRLSARFGEVSAESLAALLDPTSADAAMLGEAERLRDRALGSDEVIEPLDPAEYAAVEPRALLTNSGTMLEDYLRTKLPQVAQKDPKGIEIVARELGKWLAEARSRIRVEAMCAKLGLANVDPAAPPKKTAPEGLEGMGFEDGEPAAPAGPCRVFADLVSEADDATWLVPAGSTAPVVRELPWKVRLTGQPLIGEAYAQSVTKSLYGSTLVSVVALGVVLVIGRHMMALIPAVWTIAVTLGTIALLGHPIGIGTSMVSCIAMGAGVDFAIHLSVRARESTGPDPGGEAVHELGGVAIATGVQLGAAFLVLLASEMPPLREFGVGLAIGLIFAAGSAVAFAPILFRRRR
jgi:predicted RND superfamily exporter protein